MRDFYQKVTGTERSSHLHHLFRRFRPKPRTCMTFEQRGRKAKASKPALEDFMYGLATHNVGGLASSLTKLPQLFQGFREQQQNGLKNDLVLVQETHLDSAESVFAEQQYKSVWSYKQTAHSVLSFWAPAHAGERRTKARHGGVAILINLHGAIQNATPWHKELWTAHRQFIRCSLQGGELIVMNLYAPSDPKERKRYYKELGMLPIKEDTKLVVGGDFNCVTDTFFLQTYECS